MKKPQSMKRKSAKRTNWREMYYNAQEDSDIREAMCEELRETCAALEVDRNGWKQSAEIRKETADKLAEDILAIRAERDKMEVERNGWRSLHLDTVDKLEKFVDRGDKPWWAYSMGELWRRWRKK